MPEKHEAAEWFGRPVAPGEQIVCKANLLAGYATNNVDIPVYIWRGQESGPTVAVTAAVHGDEINGTGAIRHIIRERVFELRAGTVVLVPVVNILGFERHSRYLPDRRDLNRSFPGSEQGSLASRMASSFFRQVVRRCDYCIDLHTASVRRTNFPNVRADLTNERVLALARAFGSELIVGGVGPKGSLRREANRIGCATIILEAGEVWKAEQTVVEYAVRGIGNCLMFLGMIDGEPVQPAYHVETDATKWIRAEQGGFLEFHVGPGDIVEKDEAIATNTNLVGEEQNVIRAPRDGIILGMTTIPSVVPGDPVCHLAYPKRSTLRKIERVVGRLADGSLHERLRDDLSSSILVTETDDDDRTARASRPSAPPMEKAERPEQEKRRR
jgi:predicted deacylase